ncbi:response regulator [Pelomonas sp. CA6]|uniref:response regulator transcription factor n=1 Tax=Pelomonas sp. CA6 TaxID=2907999 RepID=UPI001F4C4A83|nr:response regulator [Pelomonas sp. CA6]MCH7345649.1 response regulator [Pelomonas sp. CA6]
MKKILIVDDHADIRKLLHMTLEFEDYEIREAHDGASALQAVQDFGPDLVLLDVMMPGALNGLEVCASIKSDAALASTRVVLLSARGQARDREAGLRAGADLYLVKPFSPLQLIDCIADLWVQA